jgi:hypothetical protein
MDGMSFPTRRAQSAYLSWAYERVCALAPPGVAVVVHPTHAIDVLDVEDGRQLVRLAGQPDLLVDAVILTIGHLDVDPPPQHADDQSFAERHHAIHLPPAYTADLDLSAIAPGSNVIVRGLGLAFIDLMVLLAEGRGGRFVDAGAGRLEYLPSGDEPVLFAGSRRGVPYRAKLGYRLQAGRAPVPRFLDADAIARLVRNDGELEFRRDVWPLLAKDVAFAYYHELFCAHRDRVSIGWTEFEAVFANVDWDGADRHELVTRAVPNPADRWDVEALNRPLDGVTLPAPAAVQEHVRGHIEADLSRRADPAFSADLGAFYGLLVGFGQLAQLVSSERLAPRSLVKDVHGWWFSFFSYYASGPPPRRLHELLALSRAGLVQFLGADIHVERDEQSGTWRASSATGPGTVEAGVLVEGRLPAPSVARSRSPLIAALRARGDVAEHVLYDERGQRSYNTGKLTVASDLRIVDAGGRTHPRRFAAGIHTSRPAGGTFARPRTNAASLRQNDALARRVLQVLLDSDRVGGDLAVRV